jgi:hypothetical protein
MKDINDFIEVNKDIFDIEEHRIKMNVPPQAEFYGFTLVNPKNNQFVSKLIVGQECTAIFMTPKQMKKSFIQDVFLCPILELTLNLSLFPEQILLPLAVYAYQDGEDTKFIFAGFDNDELKKMIVGTSPRNRSMYS